MEKYIEIFDANPIAESYKSLARRYLIGQKIDSISSAQREQIFGQVLETSFSNLSLAKQEQIYKEWCYTECYKEFNLTNNDPDGVYMYPSSHKFEDLIAGLYSKKFGVSLDTQAFLSKRIFEDNTTFSISNWLGNAKANYDIGRDFKTLGSSGITIGGIAYTGYKWFKSGTAVTCPGIYAALTLLPVLYDGCEASSSVREFLCRESTITSNVLDTITDRKFQNLLNQSNDRRLFDLKKIIKDAGADANETTFEVFDKIPPNTGKPDLENARILVLSHKETSQAFIDAKAEPDPIRRKKIIDDIQYKTLKQAKQIIAKVDPLKKEVFAEVRLSKEELLEKIVLHHAGAALIIKGVAAGLSFVGYHKEAKNFQITADTILNVAMVGVSAFFHLMHPVQAIIECANIVINYINWLWSGENVADKNYYLEEIRTQIEVIKIQLHEVYVVQIEILNQLSNLTRKIHENHHDITTKLNNIKLSLSILQLSIFSDERLEKKSKLLGWQKDILLQLAMPEQQFDLARCLKSFNKVFMYANCTSRLIQFSGNNPGNVTFTQVKQQLLQHNRTDLGFNSLIFLYNSLGCQPEARAQNGVTHVNPTEWLRASNFIVETLLTHIRPGIKQFGDVGEKIVLLYEDAIFIQKSLAMLANHNNIKDLMREFKEKLPDFLSSCIEYVNKEIHKRMKNVRLFLDKTSITNNVHFTEKLVPIKPDKIEEMDGLFLKDRVCKLDNKSKVNNVGCYLYDEQENFRLFKVHEDLGSNPFSQNNFSIIEKQTEQPLNVVMLEASKVKLQTQFKYILRRTTKITYHIKIGQDDPVTMHATRYDYVITNDNNQMQLANPNLSIIIFDICMRSHDNFLEYMFQCEKRNIDLVKQSLLTELRIKVIERTDGALDKREGKETYNLLQQSLLSIVAFSSLNLLYQSTISNYVNFDSWFEFRFPYEDPIDLLVMYVLENCGADNFANAMNKAVKTVTTRYDDLFQNISSSLAIVNQYRELPIITSVIHKIVYCAWLYDIPLSIFEFQPPKEYLPTLHDEFIAKFKRYSDDPTTVAKDLIKACNDSNLEQITKMFELGALNLPSSDNLHWTIINAALQSLNLDIIELMFDFLSRHKAALINLLSRAIINDDYFTHIHITDKTFSDSDTLLLWFNSLASEKQNLRLLFNQLAWRPDSISTNSRSDLYDIFVECLMKRPVVDSEEFVNIVQSVKCFYEKYQIRIREVVSFLSRVCSESTKLLPFLSQITIDQLVDLIKYNPLFSTIFFMQELYSTESMLWIKEIPEGNDQNKDFVHFISVDNHVVEYNKSTLLTQYAHKKDQHSSYYNHLMLQYQMTVITYEFIKSFKIYRYLSAGYDRTEDFFLNISLRDTFAQFNNTSSAISAKLKELIHFYQNLSNEKLITSSAYLFNSLQIIEDEIHIYYNCIAIIDTAFHNNSVPLAIFTNYLKSIGINIESTRSSYESLKKWATENFPKNAQEAKKVNFNQELLSRLDILISFTQLTIVGIITLCFERLKLMDWKEILDGIDKSDLPYTSPLPTVDNLKNFMYSFHKPKPHKLLQQKSGTAYSLLNWLSTGLAKAEKIDRKKIVYATGAIALTSLGIWFLKNNDPSASEIIPSQMIPK